ncbi:MAG: adenylate cyclase [Spirochaetia bacterium]|nr:adenylate cyclase [Spirochaetia bacterium]
MTRRIFLVVLFLSQLSNHLLARAFDLSDSFVRREIGQEVEVLEDPGGILTIEDVRSGPASHQFHPGESPALNYGFTHSAYWIRFRLSNHSNQPAWLLQIAFPLIDQVDFYREEKKATNVSVGMTYPFAAREFQHRTFVFRLKPDPEGSTYYMRFKNEDSMQIPLILWTPDAFFAADHNEQLILGGYYGILGVMAVYNFFLFLSLRDKGYLYYIIYISFFGLFLLSQYGLAYEYLWPTWNTIARKLNPVLAAALEASTLLFTRTFLNTRINTPGLDRVLRIVLVGAAIASPLGFFLNLTHAAVLVVVFGLAASIGALIAGVLTLQTGYRPARYFLTAFVLLIVGAILYALKTFGAIPVSFVSQYGMQLGSALEVTLLSLGLADRMNILRLETESAQRDLLAQRTNSLEAQKELTNAYARMVPGEFLKMLGRDSILEVRPGDSVQRTMTVLFSDIRSFTELSETMTPKENFDFLNSYLRRMNPIVQRNGGYIDKYIGDAIMALFPESPEGAVRAAVEMQKELQVFNQHRIADGFRAIQMGIGIHTGTLMFGTIGGVDRMEVTVISDAVNQASRMEGLTKVYGVSTLISESTFRELANSAEYSLRMLGSFQVKGKKDSVTILEILDGLPEVDLEVRKATRSEFERGVFDYLNADFIQAQRHFQLVLDRNPADQAAVFYVKECQEKTLPRQAT